MSLTSAASEPYTMAGAACCKCGASAYTPNKLRCRLCPSLPDTPCCSEIERCDRPDASLLEAKPREVEVPSWVTDLTAADVLAPCRKDRFCPTCLVGFSGRRCPAAHTHAAASLGIEAIEIHVLGRGDSVRSFVDVMQIVGLYDCSEIELETDLAPAPRLLRHLVPLHPANCRDGKYCGNIRIGDARLYCSMKCKVEWQAKAHPFVEALLAEDFTTGHQRDAICTRCCVAFSTAVHKEHADHPWVEIISNGGHFFARVPATENWLSKFASVQAGGEGYRLLPLLSL